MLSDDGPQDPESRKDLEAAATALAHASALLVESIRGDSNELIETANAVFRVARAKFSGALADYRDQYAKDPSPV